MLCQMCKSREATVHVKEIINGEKRELHLCSVCAEKKGLTEFLLSPDSIFASLMGELSQFLESPSPVTEEEEKCPSCGLSFDRIVKKGKMGCSCCYETFRRHIVPLLEKIHGRASHRGKIPERAAVENKKRLLLYRLRHQLEEAVKKEEYEKAAQIRDQIRRIQSEGKHLGRENQISSQDTK